MATPNLKDFMMSKTRVRIIELFFANVDEMYYVRQVSRKTKQEINAVRRELERMLGFGLLKNESRGNRLYYRINPKYTFYRELQYMVAKTTGLGKKMLKNIKKLGDVNFIMLSGKFVEGRLPRNDEIDILVVGEIVLPELEALVKEEEKERGRELKFAVFSLEEFNFRKTRRDPFIMDILYSSRVMLVGSDVDFSERQIPGV